MRVEVQDAGRHAASPGSRSPTVRRLIGNDIERAVTMEAGSDRQRRLAGKPVRLRFVMKDADLYALRFASQPGVEP